MNTSYQTSVLAAIVALVFIGAASIVGLSIAGRLDVNNTPLIVTLLSSIGVIITALLSVIRTDRVLIETKRLTNGIQDQLTAIRDTQTDQSPHP